MKKKRLLKTLFATVLTWMACATGAWAQATYNFMYTSGSTVATGGNSFLYNVGAGCFLTGGMDWGSHASADHAGKVITLAAKTNGYSIYTAYYSANGVENNGYLATNGYTDGSDDADWEFTPVSVSGYTNTYTIKNGSDYLYYDASDTRVQIGASTNNNYSYWILVPKSTRDAVGDYTYYLQNVGINRPWERQVWCGYDWNQNNRGDWKNWDNNGWSNHPYYTVGGNDNNPCGEKYQRTFDFYQTISQSLPEGRYRLYAQAFWRDGSSGETYLYLSDAQQSLVQLNANGENTTESMAGASTAFSSGQYVNSVEKFLSSATANVRLGINITTANQWVIWDNFTLQYLGQVVMDYATALPSTEMTANTWYYFDVPVAGDYTLTASSSLSNICYTTDGYVKTSDTPSTWSSANQSLAVGRYYVKSSSAQTLSVAAASYTYTVGSATVNYEYVQGGETVTVTYADALTNSGEGLTINTSGITFNGNALSNAAATANGFTFTVPTGLAARSTFTLSIPAGAVGYANGNTYNAQQNITIKTPAVFDGTYYLKVAATTTDLTTYSTSTGTVGKYLARGAAWGTHATVDTYGLPIIISTNRYNLSTLQVADTKSYYHANTAADNGYDVWADQGKDNFVFATNQGYLTISAESNTSAYFKHNDADANAEEASVYFDGTGTNAGPIILWELETVAAHATNMTALKNAQAATAAAAAYADDASTYTNLNGITNVAGMETAVAALPYSKVVVGGNAPSSVTEKYEGDKPNPAPETVYSNTLAIHAPGLYRFSMQAFYRAASNENTQAMHTAGTDMPPVVLFMGDAETQIKSLYDEEGSTEKNVDYTDWRADANYNDKYYANCTDAALLMFQDGKYKNDVWFYAPAAGSYTYGVKYMGYANKNAQWFIYSPEAVTVTYYGVDDSYFDKLNAEIAKATAINSYYNNSDLTSEIVTAQAMYTAYTAKQTQVDAEIAALKAKYPTSVAVTNGNFDTAPVYRADGTTSSATQTISSNGSLYEVTGFDNSGSGNEWVYGLTAEYGTALQLNGSTPPATNIYGEATGAALGLSAGWDHSVSYAQNVTINAGRYILYYEYYNQNSGSATIGANEIGLDGTFSSKTNGFTYGEWGRDLFTVDIYENGTYTLNVGMFGGGSSNGNAKLWVDNVELYRIGDAVPAIQTADGIVTVLGGNALADINAALTNTISVVNLEKATGLSSAAISTTNNPNLLIYAKNASQVNNTKNVIVNGTCSSLELQKSTTAFIVPTAFTATNAKYTVVSGELAGGNFATLMIPFAASLPSGGSAYTLDQGVNLIDGNIYGTAVTAIAANSPVIVTASGNYTGSSVTVPAVASGATFTNGELIGTYTAMDAPANSYVLQNHSNRIAFYLVGTTQPTVNPFRAYIKPQASNVKAISVMFDEDGISAAQMKNEELIMNNAEIFNVAGQRLSKPQRGVNIINGKKVIVK